jgi:CubicO group peptidase (beta-lactamase class C family)
MDHLHGDGAADRGCADRAATAMSDHAAEIDAVMQEALQVWQVPGASVLVVQGDEVVYLKQFGVRELGRDERVTPETLFAVGSTTIWRRGRSSGWLSWRTWAGQQCRKPW